MRSLHPQCHAHSSFEHWIGGVAYSKRLKRGYYNGVGGNDCLYGVYHIEGKVESLVSMLGLEGAVVSYGCYSIDTDYNPHGSRRSVLRN